MLLIGPGFSEDLLNWNSTVYSWLRAEDGGDPTDDLLPAGDG